MWVQRQPRLHSKHLSSTKMEGVGKQGLSLIPSTIKQNWKSGFFIFMKSTLFKFCYLYFGNITKIKNEAISPCSHEIFVCLFSSVAMCSARINHRPPVHWTNVLPLSYTFPAFLKTFWSVSSQS